MSDEDRNRPRSPRPPHPFGTLLRSYRTTAALSQKALATKARIAERTVSDLERGLKAPHLDTIQFLSRGLGLTGDARKSFIAEAVATLPAGVNRRVDPADTQVDVDSVEDAPHNPSPVFIGRVDDVRAISTFLTSGQHGLLIVHGPSGVGKTCLVDEAVRMARATNARILIGRENPEYGRAYGSIARAIESDIGDSPLRPRRAALVGCAWLSRIVHGIYRDTDAAPDETLPFTARRRAIIASVRRYLSNVAGPNGTALVLDDLQWSHPDTLDLLYALVRGPAAHPSLRVVGIYDDDGDAAGPSSALDIFLAALDGHITVDRLEVSPLDGDRARQTLDAYLGDMDGVDEEGRAAVVEAAHGLPLILSLAAHAWRAGGVRPVLIGVADLTHLLVDHLSPVETDVLDILAFLAYPAPVATLAVLCGRTQETIEEALGLRRMSAITREGGRTRVESDGRPQTVYSLAHAAIAATILASLSPRRRAQLRETLLTRRTAIAPAWDDADLDALRLDLYIDIPIPPGALLQDTARPEYSTVIRPLLDALALADRCGAAVDMVWYSGRILARLQTHDVRKEAIAKARAEWDKARAALHDGESIFADWVETTQGATRDAD